MNIAPEIWEIIKMAVGGYAVFILNRADRNQREMFKRIRSIELFCAGQHGVGHVHKRESDNEDS